MLTLLETVSGYRAFSHSVFEKFRFQLVSVPRVLKFILKVRFQNFQNKSPLIQRGEARTLGKFCDPLVSKYDICLIIQEHRLVDFSFLYLEFSQNLFSRAIDMACK